MTYDNKVVVLHEEKYKQIANTFVQIYDQQGEMPAARWLCDQIRLPNEEELITPYIRQAFLDNGYEIEEDYEE